MHTKPSVICTICTPLNTVSFGSTPGFSRVRKGKNQKKRRTCTTVAPYHPKCYFSTYFDRRKNESNVALRGVIHATGYEEYSSCVTIAHMFERGNMRIHLERAYRSRTLSPRRGWACESRLVVSSLGVQWCRQPIADAPLDRSWHRHMLPQWAALPFCR